MLEQVALLAGDNVMLEAECAKVHRKITATAHYKFCDIPLSVAQIDAMRKITDAADVLVRLTGETGYAHLSSTDDRDLSSAARFKRNVQAAIVVYDTISSAVAPTSHPACRQEASLARLDWTHSRCPAPGDRWRGCARCMALSHCLLTREHMRLLTIVGSLAAVAALAVACSPGSERWKEEVQLGDGTVTIVERETVLEGGGDEWAYNRAGVKPKEYRIRYTGANGGGGQVEWKSIKKSEMTWPESPLIFDLEAGLPVVYSIVDVNLACEVYVKCRYENGAWKEVPLPERFEQRPTNLLLRSGTDMPPFVTLREKLAENANPSYRDTMQQVGPDHRACECCNSKP